MSLLSVILPSFNEEANIANTATVIGKILEDNQIELSLFLLTMVQKTKHIPAFWNKLKKNSRVVGLRFSRNFGKEACIFAGLERAKGDCCAVMDCDLQHPPKTLVEMYRPLGTGLSGGGRASKKPAEKKSILYKISAKLFYKMIKQGYTLRYGKVFGF